MIYNKPLRQKKVGAGLFERADYGVSSAKALRVIWTAEGSVKCTDARHVLVVGSMIVLCKGTGYSVKQGGTADIVLFVLDR